MFADRVASMSEISAHVRVYSPSKELRKPYRLVCDLFRDIWDGRELSWRLFVRDFKAQYSQTALGYVWAFLPPLFASFTFVFLQQQGFVRVEGLGVSYAAFAMIGTMLWQTFVESIQSPLQALTSAKPMLAKINFPRESILVAGMYMVLVSTLIRMLMIFGIMLAWGIVPGVSLLLLPFFLFGLMVCGFAFGMAMVPLGGLYGDIARSIPIFTQFWMLLTPVVYPEPTSGWAGWLSNWNPVASILAMCRATLTNDPLDRMGLACTHIVLFSFVSLVGVVCFRLIMPHLIARMGG